MPNGVYIRGKLWDPAVSLQINICFFLFFLRDFLQEIDILLDIWKTHVSDTKSLQIELIRCELIRKGFDRTTSQISAKIGNITNEFRSFQSKNIPVSESKQLQFDKLSSILQEQCKVQQTSKPPSDTFQPLNISENSLSQSMSKKTFAILNFKTYQFCFFSVPQNLVEKTLENHHNKTPGEMSSNYHGITGDPLIDFYLLNHYQESLEHQRRGEILKFILKNFFSNDTKIEK